jgi:hypothetical protein
VQEFMATAKPIMPSKFFIRISLSAFHKDPILEEMNNPLLDEST